MRKVLVTGVAGFIGSNTAARLMESGWHVVGCDNLSRSGTLANLGWLRSLRGEFTFEHTDIRVPYGVDALLRAHRNVSAVIHLAGQVAVTTSVLEPRGDFEANALGTLNVLEAVRAHAPDALVIYSSTNKVYGDMADVGVVENAGRYGYRDRPYGIPETWPLDFHSPYGCSKGAADQYVRDYARIYGMRTVVLRQSCIYGPRQFGIEDQGWIAWFTIAALLGRPLTIYGDGKQVRDALWVSDLVALYERLLERADRLRGSVYNVGGGPERTLSLNDLVSILSELSGREIRPAMSDWRPGDQKVFIADIRKAQSELGWRPEVTPEDGVRRLWDWVTENRSVIEAIV